LRAISATHRSSILIAISALRFLYKITLPKGWTFEEIIPAPKKPQKLPVVLSPEGVMHFMYNGELCEAIEGSALPERVSASAALHN